MAIGTDDTPRYIESIYLGTRGLVLLTDTGACYELRAIQSQWRWYHGSTLVSRRAVEAALDASPGFIDGIEFLFCNLRLSETDTRSGLNDIGYDRAFLERNRRRAQETIAKEVEEEIRQEWQRYRPGSGRVPDALTHVSGIKRFEGLRVFCHVYFLLFRGTVVYVGQTNERWPARIFTHIREGLKEFDDCWYIEVEKEKLNEVENRYIQQFRPRYNRVGFR
jgi:hypothetical protein